MQRWRMRETVGVELVVEHFRGRRKFLFQSIGGGLSGTCAAGENKCREKSLRNFVGHTHFSTLPWSLSARVLVGVRRAKRRVDIKAELAVFWQLIINDLWKGCKRSDTRGNGDSVGSHPTVGVWRWSCKSSSYNHIIVTDTRGLHLKWWATIYWQVCCGGEGKPGPRKGLGLILLRFQMGLILPHLYALFGQWYRKGRMHMTLKSCLGTVRPWGKWIVLLSCEVLKTKMKERASGQVKSLTQATPIGSSLYEGRKFLLRWYKDHEWL